MSRPDEKWQLMIGNEVYEADAETIKQWILEGRVQQADKVRKGNLTWREAARIPQFRDLFPSTLAAPAAQPVLVQFVKHASCRHHPDTAPHYICMRCVVAYCRHCANSVGNSSGSICELCGELCQPFTELKEKILMMDEQRRGFGFADFSFALSYPLTEPISIALYGALFGVSLFSSVYVIFGPAIAATLLFPFCAYVIRHVAQGRKDAQLFVFDLGELNNHYQSALFVGLTILLVCAGPYSLYQFSEVLKQKDPWLIFTNFMTLFAPKLNTISLLLLAWAILYFPIALLIGAITESALAVCNPALALNVLAAGLNYVKAFCFYLASCVMGGLMIVIGMKIFIGGIADIASASPYQLIIAFALIGVPAFYMHMVIACLLGRLLFKSGERLGLPSPV